MNYPSISEYVEAIKSAEDNFATLTYLRPVFDETGNLEMSSGNFAVVFKMIDVLTNSHYAIKCFLRNQEGRRSNYKKISKELQSVSAPYIPRIWYYENELYVDTKNSSNLEFDVLVMDWIEGITLGEYILTIKDDSSALKKLSQFFSVMSMWLLNQPFAHGDIKPDNIIVNPKTGSLALVDYDGMYIPSMKGEKSRECGSPDYRHPKRSIARFNEYIDDFSLSVIQLFIDTVYANSKLSAPFDIKFFSLREADYLDVAGSYSFTFITENFFYDLEVVTSYQRVLELLRHSRHHDILIEEFVLFDKNDGENNSEACDTLEDLPHLSDVSIMKLDESIDNNFRVWYDCYGVKYSVGWQRLLLFPYDLELEDYTIHNQCEVIGKESFEVDEDPSEWGVYYHGNRLNKLVIPNSVRTIETDALIGCHNLVDIYLPESLISIGDSAFSGCESLEHINLPSSIELIGKNVFPKNLSSINIVSSRLISKDNYFYSCDGILFWVNRNLNMAEIPEGIKIIRSGALDLCNNLKEVVFPSTLEIIDGPGLSDSVTNVKSKSSHILSDNNCVFTSDGILLWVKKDLHYFTFPLGIKTVGKDAFNECTKLQNITFPNTITSIPHHIGMCHKLDWIYLPDTIIDITEGSLKTNYGQGKYYSIHFPTIYIPKGTWQKFKSLEPGFYNSHLIEVDSVITASSILPGDKNLSPSEDRCVYHSRYSGNRYSRLLYYGNTYQSEYHVKEGTEVICDDCFDDLYSEFDSNYLSKLFLPSSLRIIGTDAFCASIEEIICDSPYFKIENEALFSSDGTVLYKYFGKQKSYSIPIGVEEIIGGAFSGMKIETIIIPSTVRKIGNNPFAGVSRINKSGHYSCEINLICQSSFFEIRQDCLVRVSDNHLIAYLKNDTDVFIDNIFSIGPNAFYAKDCKHINISSQIQFIDEFAFGFCFNIESVKVPKNAYTQQCKVSSTPHIQIGDDI